LTDTHSRQVTEIQRQRFKARANSCPGIMLERRQTLTKDEVLRGAKDAQLWMPTIPP